MAYHILRALVLGCALYGLAACGDKAAAPPATAGAGAPATPVAMTLDIHELQPGTGPAVAAGQRAVVNYTGWLYETSAADHKGKEFDSTSSAGHPFSFVVGTGTVIKGWDRGVLGMKVGEKRRLTIPPDLGYGDTGAGDVIPPGAALIFDVELTAIE
jgi:FKBP-type peptidyl-prolyl cis-trans isomerase FkpA